MTAISIVDVSKRYLISTNEAVDAVVDFSLNVEAGHSVAILGPSGCGKTTLLRLVAGLEQPDSGRILYDGRPIDKTDVKTRGIGMVFQDYALIPHWEVRRTIGFFLRLRKRENEVPQRVHDVSAITGHNIESLMGKFPRHLSGGEKQRVAIARAFARDLQVLIFDEPFAHLDAKFRSQARIEARRLLNRFPATMLYVTHDQQEAVTMAERIVIMHHGRIIQIGHYQQLYDDPDNLFVAQFVGMPTMNFFEGEAWEGHWQGENFGGYTLPRPLPDGTAVVLGVRPEHIEIDGDVAGVVDKVAPFYAERYQLLDIWLAGETWQVQVPLDVSIRVDETLHFQLNVNKLLFFDALTGNRLRP